MKLRPASIALTALLTATAAAAEDPKSDEVSVLPWTDATLVFGSKEKRATVQYSQSLSTAADSGMPWQPFLYIKASAPLDEDTRLSGFVDDKRLVSGFAGQFQLGLDTRAGRLERWERQLRRLREGISVLGAGGVALTDDADAYTTHYRLPNESSRRHAQMRKQMGVSNFEQMADAVLKAAQVGATGDRVADLNAHLVGCESKLDYSEHDGGSAPTPAELCLIAAVANEQLQRQQVYDDLLALTSTLDPKTLPLSLPDGGTLRPSSDFDGGWTGWEAIIADIQPLHEHVEALLKEGEAAHQDLGLVALQPLDGVTDYLVALDFAGSYDRLKVFQADVGTVVNAEGVTTNPVDNDQWELSAGVNATVFFPVRGLSLTGRVGYEHSELAKAKKFEGCRTLTSTDPTFAGKQCDGTLLYRKGDPPAAANSGYFRLALDYQYASKTSKDKVIPGVELRAGLNGIGHDEALAFRLSLFGTPVKSGVAARFGVAVDVNWRLTPKPSKADLSITPLAFFGVTFEDLLSGK